MRASVWALGFFTPSGLVFSGVHGLGIFRAGGWVLFRASCLRFCSRGWVLLEVHCLGLCRV